MEYLASIVQRGDEVITPVTPLQDIVSLLVKHNYPFLIVETMQKPWIITIDNVLFSLLPATFELLDEYDYFHHFGLLEKEFMQNIHSGLFLAEDVMETIKDALSIKDSLIKAVIVLNRKNRQALPVLDEKGQYVGYINKTLIAHNLLQAEK